MPTDRRITGFNKLVKVMQDAAPGPKGQPVNWLTPGARSFYEALPTGKTGVRLTPKLVSEAIHATAGETHIYRCETQIVVETRAASNLWADSAQLWSNIAAAVKFDPTWQDDGIDDVDPIGPAETSEDQGVARGLIRFITYVAR